jgi:metal-dependent amidase/aminoacylase/carboxypeptidase family protein
VNCNSKEQAEHVLRVAAEHFGKDKVGHGKLPFRASEDFAFYTQHTPGAFFFLSTLKGS